MWYLVVSKSVAPQEVIQQHVPEHAAWLRQHHMAGNVVLSGPIADGSTGIWVIRANSRDEARRVVDAHPYHVRGLRRYEMYDWVVHQFMGEGPFSTEAITALTRERSGAT